MKKKYIRTNKYVLRTIENDILLFPTEEVGNKTQGAILINEISLDIWNLLKTPKTIDEILNNIINNYDITTEIARKDLNRLFLQFENYNVIQRIKDL